MKQAALVFCLALSFCLAGFLPEDAMAAEPAKTLGLPKPAMSGGMPLMEAMAKRRTNREIGTKPISEQDLSNLLWAAWGVNRPDGRRTIPTARNNKEAMVFAVLQNGIWRYDAVKNVLELVNPVDARSRFGDVPLVLVYAAKISDDMAGGMHVGSMYQDVGLYCASVGLGNVVKLTGRDKVDAELNLPEGYRSYIIHVIGWPK